MAVYPALFIRIHSRDEATLKATMSLGLSVQLSSLSFFLLLYICFFSFLLVKVFEIRLHDFLVSGSIFPKTFK